MDKIGAGHGRLRGAIADDLKDPEDTQTGPTFSRMLLGTQLRKLREARGVSRETAADVIRASHSKLSRLEHGRTGFKLRDVADLLTLYGLTDDSERATLLALARQSNATGWWHAYNDILPSWLQSYIGIEQDAQIIRVFEVQFVPGLLQTPDYARAVIRLGPGSLTSDRVERLVEIRTRRQRVLHRRRPPHLWVVIDEAALRRPMGSVATMRHQLRHLLSMSEMPHITVQVVPFRSGGHAGTGGGVTLLRLPALDLPDVVYLEQLHGAVFPDRIADIEGYRHMMNRVVMQAETPDDSRVTLERILAET